MTELHPSREAAIASAEALVSGAVEPTALDRAMGRYADGDDAAFAEVFAGLAPRLGAFLRRLTGSPHLAEDLMQETLLKVHQSRGSFARDRSVLPWAYAIARNCFMSHARSSKTRMARASVDVDKAELASGLDASAEETSIARESARVVERALLEMTPARREAFVLVRYEGLSMAAAAQIIGISEGALKLRAFHAYETIRLALKELEEGRPVRARSVTS